jgi:hypothetical protein
LDWPRSFPLAVEAVQALPVETCTLDAELVYLDADGHPNFWKLRQKQFARDPGEDGPVDQVRPWDLANNHHLLGLDRRGEADDHRHGPARKLAISPETSRFRLSCWLKAGSMWGLPIRSTPMDHLTLLSKVAEDFAIEILAEYSAEDYGARSAALKRLRQVADTLETAGLEVPFPVINVLRNGGT